MNIDAATEEMIDGVIQEWTQQGRAFTIYEVTREVRERRTAAGMNFIRHQDVRDYYEQSPALNDVMQGSDYTRTLITIPDPQQGTVQPWLYHLTTYDPSSYRPIDRNTLAGHSGPHPNSPQSSFGTITAIPAPATATAADDDEDTINPNVSGEVWLSNGRLAQVNLGPGDTLYIFEDNGRVIVSKKYPSNPQGVVITRQVEKRGNARLSLVVRQQVNLNGGTFAVEVSTHDGEPALVVSEA